jgi:nitrite reductase/ring-hydroxylating ferredoxin subunit
MAEYVKIGTKAELPGENQAKEFNVAGKVICVANVDGTCSAMDNVCLHRGGPIGQGPVMDGKVICPWHGWMWDPKTGQAVHSPEAKVAVYPLKIEGDDVLVEV